MSAGLELADPPNLKHVALCSEPPPRAWHLVEALCDDGVLELGLVVEICDALGLLVPNYPLHDAVDTVLLPVGDDLVPQELGLVHIPVARPQQPAEVAELAAVHADQLGSLGSGVACAQRLLERLDGGVLLGGGEPGVPLVPG
eukprot:CAMPEP_0173406594 /NCGR_PEP_ID=MMETSP1356-20130122/64947_1 /TAXON_ID=77927 ORGANISM="Hemiselmis virescens, Strain PCC157" /NCGR_SAMPLE_ID=MMETSP1356 /ASSEMBLY_ACC=CAM_ASM_000847 /LENGTH=142 /DNA_ID=CAMNT_0014367609 /DNA_START=411 /DNA_END=835 /DNA_ORIENTATION=-